MVGRAFNDITTFFYIIYFKRTKVLNKEKLAINSNGWIVFNKDSLDFFNLNGFYDKYLVDKTPYTPPPFKKDQRILM